MTTVLLTRLSPLSVKRAILSTGSIIRSLRIIGTERRPCVRAEQSIQRNIVHGDRDTEHGCQCDEIGPDVAKLRARHLEMGYCFNDEQFETALEKLAAKAGL